MQRINRYILKIVGTFLLFFSFIIDGLAQGQPPPGGPGGPGGDPGLIPVDGGLAFLVAAGLGYGAKKAYDFKRGIQKKNH